LKHKGELWALSTGSCHAGEEKNSFLKVQIGLFPFSVTTHLKEPKESTIAYSNVSSDSGKDASTPFPVMTVGGVIMQSIPFSDRRAMALPPN